MRDRLAMAGRQEDLPGLEAAADEHTVIVNGRCVVRTQDGHRVVLVAGIPIAQYTVGDRMAEAHAIVSLVEQGWAEQVEVAGAFRCSARTVRRQQRRFEDGGLVALGRPGGYPKGRPRVDGARTRRVTRLRREGHSQREIARRVGVSEKAIRKLLRRLGWRSPTAEQTVLPFAGADPNMSAPKAAPVESATPTTSSSADPKMSAPAVPLVDSTAPQSGSPGHPNLSAPIDAADEDAPLFSSVGIDPTDRTLDRLLAAVGLLDDAEPLFADARRLPRAGVLLAIPALLDSGVLDVARQVYGSLAPAFYGLRTTIVTLLLMALLRIKRPEALKEHSPPELGRLLGLDRAPEVKTIRRKLTRLAAAGRAIDFGRLLARRRVASVGVAVGFLYVDGHVRVYHGKRKLPKAHVTRLRLALPATTDYWINDTRGDPVFVVTAPANAGLTKMLPALLAEARTFLGDRRVTVVFDRGGWSPRLFGKILDAGFDLLTYRKGPVPALSHRRFYEDDAIVEGREVRYTLADTIVTLDRGRLCLRQITRLSEDRTHQTQILTSRDDLPAAEVAFRMFERWTQENFFKYLREEYALDALVDYHVEPDDPTREVPNPQWLDLTSRIQAARSRVAELERQVGARQTLAAIAGGRRHRRSSLDATVGHALADALAAVIDLQRRRARVPSRVPVGEREQGPIIKLATERKHLTNVLKMIAYQAESDLVRLITPHFRRAEHEGRTLVQAALASAADLRVTDGELQVTLAPQSAPHRTAAIAALCRALDACGARFPGTRLRLRYAIADTG